MTERFVPADQAERDRIRDDVGVNMCVEAGAGTGKTTVLVDRIVNVIASGHADVQHLAVITFTEKAAAELAARVRQGLEASLADAPAGDRRSRIESAMRNLNQAHIETIHAFASALLRERPVEAALDPGFEVLDELPAQLAFETAYDEWLTSEMGEDDPPDALVDALNLGLNFTLVREAAEHLHRNRDLLPLAAYEHQYTDARATIGELLPHIDTLRSYESCVVNDSDDAYGELRRMLTLFDDLQSRRNSEASVRRTIATTREPWTKKGSQGNWRRPSDCKAVKAALTEINTIIVDARDAMRQAAIANLVLWLQGFVRQYEDRRRSAGKADFDDLLIWARDLVTGNPAVRAYFQEKYRCVLVDEFQDTDPLQVEMIVALCAAGEMAADWRHTPLRQGSLFVVGDPKQSIYRFRRADIAMYDEVKEHVFTTHQRTIVQNFRSVQPVIDWVNRTFESQMLESRGVQPRYIPLDPHPELFAEDAITVVRAVAPSSTQRAASADDIRRCEGALLGSLIRKSIDHKSWLVRQRGSKDVRPAAYRDIVIIIPSRSSLELYEDELARAGVPYRHEGGRTFFQRQEVRELVAVLRAIDDPADGVAAVAALRSAAFGCSDAELLLHRQSGGRFDYKSLRRDAAGPVADSMRVLDELANMRHTHTLPELVRATLDRTRLVEFAMLQPQGEQVAANMLKVIDQARTFAEASGSGLRGFVRWLKVNISRTADETDAVISEETDDVVRILTVHAAKGLEFPVVVFANMNTERVDRTKVIVDGGRRRLHVKLGAQKEGFRTPGYDDADATEKHHGLAEELRLLYVAATRARDRLVLAFVEGEAGSADAKLSDRGPKCLNDWLRQAGAHEAEAIDPATLPAFDAELPVWRRRGDAASATDIERVAARRDAWLSMHAALVERGSAPLSIRTASALKPEWERPQPADDGVRRGTAADFGSAVHALLERCRLQEDRIDALAPAIAAEFGQQGRIDEMLSVARRALASDVVARARRAPRMLLEAPFTAALPDAPGSALAEGRIDLLFEERGGIVIVDFKTDAVTTRDVAERAQFYRNQALVYAWAVRTATNMPPTEVVFLFARPGTERAIAVNAAFEAEADALMRSPAVATAEHRA